MKFCKDCKHCAIEEDYGPDDPICNSPKNGKISPVTGEREPEYKFCGTHRHGEGWLMSIFMGTCGVPGRWFEPKEPA